MGFIKHPYKELVFNTKKVERYLTKHKKDTQTAFITLNGDYELVIPFDSLEDMYHFNDVMKKKMDYHSEKDYITCGIEMIQTKDIVYCELEEYSITVANPVPTQHSFPGLLSRETEWKFLCEDLDVNFIPGQDELVMNHNPEFRNPKPKNIFSAFMNLFKR